MTTSFAQLGLPSQLVDTLAKSGIVEPFPIQSSTIPDALAGRDVSGRAPTGSGKTLAFGLPLLAKIGTGRPRRPKALVLAPTRELAEQIKRELSPLARAKGRSVLAVYGGVGYGPQKGRLRKGVDVLVATPGRLEDLIEQGSVDLSRVDFVVVDEADRMADMGFLPIVRRLLDRTSQQRQTLLFSATLDGDIAVLTRDYQRDPVLHESGGLEEEKIDARHLFWLVQHQDRVDRTAEALDTLGASIVFTRTRRGADRLAKQLGTRGVNATAMHGGLSQNQRMRSLRAFSSGKAQALIATDVAARGIHIDAVAAVIHFDPAADSKDYLHRSGRTARAGASGLVLSIVTNEQRRAVRQLQHDLDLHAPIEEPSLGALAEGGYRIGDPVPKGVRIEPLRKRPATRPQRRPRRTSTGPSIYIANLPWAATEEDVQTLFGRYGEVEQTTIITDRRTGRSRGFGFIDMPEPAARTAIEALHGSRLEGRDLTVRFAKPRQYQD